MHRYRIDDEDNLVEINLNGDRFNEEPDEDETYEDFLQRTGVEDTQQHYEMFITGEYDDEDY